MSVAIAYNKQKPDKHHVYPLCDDRRWMTRALTVAAQQIRTSYLRPSSSPSSKSHVSLPRGSVGVGKVAGTCRRRLS